MKPGQLNEQQYNLVCYIEECAENIQIGCKMLRFGVHDIWPNPEKNPLNHTNAQRLNLEFNDLLTCAQELRNTGIVLDHVPKFSEAKRKRLEQYKGYSRQQGILWVPNQNDP